MADNAVKRILVIRTHRMGDILQVTPMIRGLRERYPDAHLAVLVAETFAEVLARNPDLDEVIAFPRVRLAEAIRNDAQFSWAAYRELRELLRRLRGSRFDRIINRQFTDFEAVLSSLAGAGAVRGKTVGADGRFCYGDPVTARVVEQTRQFGRNPALKNLVDLSMAVAGVSPSLRGLVFPVRPHVTAACEQRLREQGWGPNGPCYGIQPGASRGFKKLGSAGLAALVDHLVEARRGRVLLFGSPSERALGEEITGRLGVGPGAILNLMGETTLEELGGFLGLCDLLITGDTGTVHVAAAVGTRTLCASYGMTYPYETAPYGPGHLVLYGDLPCAPCDDPNRCTSGMACRRVLAPEVLTAGVDLQAALAAGDAAAVARLRDAAPLVGMRLLHTGESEITGDLKLYDLQREIPPLRAASVVRRGPVAPMASASHNARLRLRGLLGKIGGHVEAALAGFVVGEKETGFVAIVPIFDLWVQVLDALGRFQEAADVAPEAVAGMAVFRTDLLRLLQRIERAVTAMDLAALQDVLSMEMQPLLADLEASLQAVAL